MLNNPPPAQPQLRKRPDEVGSEINQQLASLANRIKLVEERIESSRNYLTVVEQSIVDKHKNNITEIRDLEEQARETRAILDELKDLVERIAKRLDAFASKEEVKVLQRYVDLWQPMKFVSRSEVTNIVNNILEQQNIKKHGD